MDWMNKCYICGAEDVPLEIQRCIVPLTKWPEHALVEGPEVTPEYTHIYPICMECLASGLIL